MTDLKALAAEFPRDAIHWRAQTVTKNGDKALALAYLDARDVMDRLDEVCGPDGWSDSYIESAKGRVICTISIHCGAGWVAKSDGAGDTDVEGEKGGISDAFKRAAVKWGIGRYLYRLDAVWAPCETYERNGKLVWKAWKGSPWDSVRNKPSNVVDIVETVNDAQFAEITTLIQTAGVDTRAFCERYKIEAVNQLPMSKFEAAARALQGTIKSKKESA